MVNLRLVAFLPAAELEESVEADLLVVVDFFLADFFGAASFALLLGLALLPDFFAGAFLVVDVLEDFSPADLVVSVDLDAVFEADVLLDFFAVPDVELLAVLEDLSVVAFFLVDLELAAALASAFFASAAKRACDSAACSAADFC
ncbi:hypothetical protein-transmembrane prediction [Rhodopirellula baltica SH 1]|uniref:Uncharacterized protein n=1 Tax=Rhodopirellula baltica (strain DSM 10527 / NCIMB 13988 / SH1) TaxID=243090 RepID=Q7URR2_RHOBA|nr:hypothetical protein-transmembrane prediction [Rhodopirellula baltica SH 1]